MSLEPRHAKLTDFAALDPPGNDELSLRDAMREGATEAELLSLVWAALQGKHARHAGAPRRAPPPAPRPSPTPSPL